MHFIVENKIIVNEPTDEIKKWCRDNLVLDNPEFHQKERMGVWTGNTPRTISLYEIVGDEWRLPFGCLDTLWRKYGKEYPFIRNIDQFKPLDYKSGINLYPYQEKAVKMAYACKNGIILAPCGSGKTQMGIELIARLKGRTLWLTHTKDLLKQSMDRAKAVLGADAKTYGTITDGKINIGSGITFATVQTMAKIDLKDLKNAFDVVIVDEVQHCAGSPTKVTQFYKVVSALSCRYKYGLTATLHRADGLERSITALLGDVCAEVTREEVAHTTSPVVVKPILTGWMPNYDVVLAGDGTIEYSSLVNDMIHNQSRFNAVMDVVNSLDGSAIVLANRIEYLQEFQKAYKGKSVCLSGMGNSKASKNIRENALVGLKDGTIDCIFATYQLCAEGLDVPSLKYVVFATPEKDVTKVTQSAGRVGRKADGKEFGTVIDFVDEFGMLKGWWNKRKNIYTKLKYNIDI